ncbi:MAG: hypothetical protein U0573_03070 [Phycisphaerales bacterium]|nr:hypothetical protein [Planctomycetota bacterium]
MKTGWMLALAVASGAVAGTPPWTEGFETYSGSFGGEWYGNAGYFRVSSTAPVHGGAKCLRLDAAAFGDYGSQAGSMYGWLYNNTSSVVANIVFTPAGPETVVTLSGYVSIQNLQTGQRPVALALEMLNGSRGTLGKMYLFHDGFVDTSTTYGYDNQELAALTDYWSAGPIAEPGEWNKFSIRADFANGVVRYELNDGLINVSAFLAGGMGGVLCDVAALAKIPAGNGSQPKLLFDDLRAESSPHCEGDLDLNGIVDDADAWRFMFQYDVMVCDGLRDAVFCSADLNRDGLVDDADFSLFAVAYDGFGCPQP